MTPKESVLILARLKSAYPRQVVSRETIEIYAQMLADLDASATWAAVRRLIASSKWFPTVAEIREEVARAELDALPSPEVAWKAVRLAVGNVGAYGVPRFDCDAIAGAVAVIGWKTICLDENVMSTRARFIDAYRALYGRAHRGEQLGQFATPRLRAEREERRRGSHKPLGDSIRELATTQPEPSSSQPED